MSLPGLPPLPKSLSGIEISQQQNQLQRSLQRQVNLTPSDNRTTDSSLDTQLAILRREMVSFMFFNYDMTEKTLKKLK